MYTVLILMILGAIAAIYIAVIDDGFDGMSIIAGLTGALVGMLLGILLGFCLPTEIEPTTRTRDLVTLQDNSSTSGHFFLGSGTIDGTMKYAFYYMTEDSLFHLGTKNADRSSIKYVKTKPLLRINGWKLTKHWKNNWGLDSHVGKETNVFEVPEGTILTGYSLDAK